MFAAGIGDNKYFILVKRVEIFSQIFNSFQNNNLLDPRSYNQPQPEEKSHNYYLL